MTRPDTTGYGPGEAGDPPARLVSYTLDEHANPMLHGVFAQVRSSDGRTLGLLQFESEEELKWFRKALSNDRRRTEEEIQTLEENG